MDLHDEIPIDKVCHWRLPPCFLLPCRSAACFPAALLPAALPPAALPPAAMLWLSCIPLSHVVLQAAFAAMPDVATSAYVRPPLVPVTAEVPSQNRTIRILPLHSVGEIRLHRTRSGRTVLSMSPDPHPTGRYMGVTPDRVVSQTIEWSLDSF